MTSDNFVLETLSDDVIATTEARDAFIRSLPQAPSTMSRDPMPHPEPIQLFSRFDDCEYLRRQKLR